MSDEPDTPYFVCDARELRRNCEIVEDVRAASGAKVLFAIKSFTMCKIFPHMARSFDGVVASSLYEARIGREHFCGQDGEVHAYSPAFTADELAEIVELCDSVVFNSQAQLARYGERVRAAGLGVGLRLNPEVAQYHQGAPGLNFCSRGSRLGVRREALRPDGLEEFDGVLFHVHSENAELDRFEEVLRTIEATFGEVLGLPNIRWISLGGGISFTRPDYPLAEFAARLRSFAECWDAQVLLEPGTAISSSPFRLHATVLDIVHNELPIAIVDVSAEAHLPDRVLFGLQYPIVGAAIEAPTPDRAPNSSKSPSTPPGEPGHVHLIGGVSCLGGDELGCYRFERPLAVGDRVVFDQVGDYTMVQQNFFNGVRRPSVYFRHESGELELIKRYGYEDFLRLWA